MCRIVGHQYDRSIDLPRGRAIELFFYPQVNCLETMVKNHGEGGGYKIYSDFKRETYGLTLPFLFTTNNMEHESREIKSSMNFYLLGMDPEHYLSGLYR